MEQTLTKVRKTAIFVIALIFVCFHIYTSAFGLFEGMSQRTIHLTLMLLLVVLFKPCKVKYVGPAIDALLIVAILVQGIYMFGAAPDMAYRAGTVYTMDKVGCTLLIILILVSTKRVMGWAMPIIGAIMMVYVFFGQYLPQPFGHAPYSMKKITSLLYMGTEGIWSSPLAASATFIPLFIMFGCMLEAFGGGAFFMDFSSALFGKYRGGPAKVAVISSGLMGSISGSAVANVTTTGAFTIPLMKKLGYDKDFAGAVEATASTGGQLAPPVMGAGAFLMSEILAVPYATIVKAAIIPALLYYLGCFFVVDFEAGRLGLSGMRKEELPVFKEVMKKGWYNLFPLIMLIYMLVFAGTSALKASFYAVLVTLVIGAITGTRDKAWLMKLKDSVIDTANSCTTVATATACAGLIIGAFAVTGLGTKLSMLIISLAGGKLFLVLLLTAVSAIILGMGLPTVAAYSILVTLIVGTLAKMGVSQLSAHMFIFYFGIISNVTPPVALAAFAAAGLSGGSAIKTGLKATKLALAGFLIPFVFIYAPAILMVGTPMEIISVSVSALVGVYALSVATIGYFFTNCNWIERAVCFAAGICMVIPGTVTDLIGVAFFATVIVMNRIKAKKKKAQTAQ